MKKTSKALIVHEDNQFVGYGAEIAAQIADKTFEWLDAPRETVRPSRPPNHALCRAVGERSLPQPRS